MPFSPKVNGDEKFGFPRNRTKPKNDDDEATAWNVYYKCVQSEIQIILNTCMSKYLQIILNC